MATEIQQPADDLLMQAASGSTEAQAGLAGASMAAGRLGTVPQVRALMAAEAWARLAAAGGDRAAAWALVEVFSARIEFEIGRCAVTTARWYEDEARRVLKPLAEAGDDVARHTLSEIGSEIDPDHQGPTLTTQRNLVAAARGSLVAIISLYDEAMSFFDESSDPGEALAVAEVYARLGSQRGNGDLLQRLAGVLLKRAELDYRDGNSALGEAAHAEATFLIAVLVDTDYHHLKPWLADLVMNPTLPAIVKAIRLRPTILNHLQPQGTC